MPEESTIHAEINLIDIRHEQDTAISREWLMRGYDFLGSLNGRFKDIDVGIAVADADVVEIETESYSPNRWNEVIEMQVASPEYASIHGLRSNDSPAFRYRVEVARNISPARMTRLVVSSKAALDQISDSAYCARWFEFLQSCTIGASPAWGVATDDNLQLNTSLDMALRRPFTKSIPQSRVFLRGYSWITVCPEELLIKLGGKAALVASTAFFRVEALVGGGAILQATETLAEYGDSAMRKVFHKLAPVLPPGLPKRVPGYKDIRVVYEDAANFD